jgi:phosphopantothenoylcysteine synthetase/decarboxylase
VALDTLYVIVSGAGTARRVPGFLPGLVGLAPRVLTVLTPNAQRVVSPRELALIPGHQIIESYFDPAILPRPPRGVVLFAPCSFNSLNKLAGGIADNLALSITAEAIGRGTPVVVAISVNAPLWAHPLAARSAATLRGWGCEILDPMPAGDSLTLAPDDAIIEAAGLALGAGF